MKKHFVKKNCNLKCWILGKKLLNLHSLTFNLQIVILGMNISMFEVLVVVI